MKHLQYYLDWANDADQTSKYSSFIGAQASGAYYYGKDSANDIGTVWYAPNAGGSVFSPIATASGLDAFNAAAKVSKPLISRTPCS